MKMSSKSKSLDDKSRLSKLVFSRAIRCDGDRIESKPSDSVCGINCTRGDTDEGDEIEGDLEGPDGSDGDEIDDASDEVDDVLRTIGAV